jgi:hypothetical protein
MDPLLASSSVAELLKSVHGLLGLSYVGHEDDPEVCELPVLTAVYHDVNWILLSSQNSPTLSIDQALRRCKSTQENLLGLLDSIGYSKLKRSSRRWDRIRYNTNLFLNQSQLARAHKFYREAVLLLRDVAFKLVAVPECRR